jgi:hypothetical protein
MVGWGDDYLKEKMMITVYVVARYNDEVMTIEDIFIREEKAYKFAKKMQNVDEYATCTYEVIPWDVVL